MQKRILILLGMLVARSVSGDESGPPNVNLSEPVLLKIVFDQNGRLGQPKHWDFSATVSQGDRSVPPLPPNVSTTKVTFRPFGGHQPSANPVPGHPPPYSIDISGSSQMTIDLYPDRDGQTWILGTETASDTRLLTRDGRPAKGPILPGNYCPPARKAVWMRCVIPKAALFTDYSTGSAVVLGAVYKVMIADHTGESGTFNLDNWGMQ